MYSMLLPEHCHTFSARHIYTFYGTMILTVFEKIESAEAEMDVKWTYKTQGTKAVFPF
jgi:hypothetical protein